MEGIVARTMSMKAAADYLGPGALEVPIFEREITDMVRRSSVALQRFQSPRATGHPHRYFEQTGIASASSVDPRNLSSSGTTPTRVERPAFIKATISQTNIGLFDKEVTEQQGQFEGVVAKDINDVISAIEVKRGGMLWSGIDTSMSSPTQLEWMGALAQITGAGGTINIATIAPGTSIIDGVKSVVAALVSQTGFVVKPTGIYLNDVLGDYIDQEAKAAHIELAEMEVVAGTTVAALSTRAGKLPLIGDAFMPTDTAAKYGFSAPPAGYKNYYAAIIMESETEIPYISGKTEDPKPRIFQLGLVGNLSGQFVGVKFDTLIIKGASYAHAVICVQRP